MGLPPIDHARRNEWGEFNCRLCAQWLPSFEFETGRATCKRCTPRRVDAVRMEMRDQIIKAQAGRCAICRDDITGVKNGRAAAHIDHDHACCPGALARSCGSCIRAALCARCNHGLGNFRDSIDNLMAAVAYLTFWENGLPTAGEPADREGMLVA